MPTLWLLPKVWFHGSQSTSTGGSSASAGIDWRDLLLVGAPHALRVDDRLGQLGRARGEQELGDGVRAGGRHRGIDGRGGRGRRAGCRRRWPGSALASVAVARSTTSTSARHDRGDGAAEARGVAGEHQPGRQRVEDMAQLVVVLADGGIGRRDRAVGNAGVDAAERQQRVLEAVLAQDHHRPLGGQAAVEQGLADAARAVAAPRA